MNFPRKTKNQRPHENHLLLPVSLGNCAVNVWDDIYLLLFWPFCKYEPKSAPRGLIAKNRVVTIAIINWMIETIYADFEWTSSSKKPNTYTEGATFIAKHSSNPIILLVRCCPPGHSLGTKLHSNSVAAIWIKQVTVPPRATADNRACGVGGLFRSWT